MGWILRKYAIREMVVPTVLSLVTITFILIIGIINDMVQVLLMPGVETGAVLEVLLDMLPSVLVFATPMALLIGVLIGVGRMTLDREVLAIRAHGLNLFSVFSPAMALGLIVSLALLVVSAQVVPRTTLAGMREINKLKLSVASALEPGRFYEELGGEDDGFIFYFRERSEQTRRMQGIVIKLEGDLSRHAPETLDQEEVSVAQPWVERLPSLLASTAMAQAPGGGLAGGAGPRSPDVTTTWSENDLTSPGRLADRDAYTLIFASSGSIKAETIDQPGSDQAGAVRLLLRGGSIHRLEAAASPELRDYVVISFDQLEKQLFPELQTNEIHDTRTSGQLRAIMADPERDEETRGKAAKTYWERITISLAAFVFVVMGIPLAIWIRPSGKSWGILLAVGLMLIYYVLIQMGLSVIEMNRPQGVPMTLMPNCLFLLLGGVLWWRTLRA